MKSLAAATAAIAVIALAGCSYVNPITTQEYYSASDGVHLSIEEVEALNLIVLTTGEGEPSALVGTLVNRGDEDVDLRVSLDGQTATDVSVPAGETVSLSPIDGVNITGDSPVMPGLLTEVGFATDSFGLFTMDAPVLDGTLPQYAELVDAIG